MAQIEVPSSDVSTGSWSANSGSTLYTQIDEGSVYSDSDYISSSDGGSDDTCEVHITDPDTPFQSGNYYIKYRAKVDQSFMYANPNMQVQLMQGATQIDTFTDTGITTSYTDDSHEVTDVSGISDWTDLRFKITMKTDGMGGGGALYLSNIYFEVPDQDSGGGSAKIPVTLFINGMST